MELNEAVTASQALLLQAAAIAGVQVTPQAMEKLQGMVLEGFPRIDPTRRAEAVSNMIKYIGVLILRSEIDSQLDRLSTSDRAIRMTDDEVCPVYPFK